MNNLSLLVGTKNLVLMVVFLCLGIIGVLASDERTEKVRINDLDKVLLMDIEEMDKKISSGGRGVPATQVPSSPATSPSKSSIGKESNVVLLFDVSRSVANKSQKKGVPMDKIKEEVVSLVDSLPAETRFNVVQFTRNYLPFSSVSVPNDAAQRKAFRAWVRDNWNESGTLSSVVDGAVKNPDGILGVLKFAKSLNPSVVYVISDASFNRGKANQTKRVEWSDLDKAVRSLSARGKRVPVNFIAFAPAHENAQAVQRIAKQSGGQFRELTN